MLKEKLDKILLKVQKPSRYIGGEVNAVVKDKSKVDIRFAFCFPDTYDIGMSHLGTGASVCSCPFPIWKSR